MACDVDLGSESSRLEGEIACLRTQVAAVDSALRQVRGRVRGFWFGLAAGFGLLFLAGGLCVLYLLFVVLYALVHGYRM